MDTLCKINTLYMIEWGNLTCHLALRRRMQSEFQINSFFFWPAIYIVHIQLVGECNTLRFLSLFFLVFLQFLFFNHF